MGGPEKNPPCTTNTMVLLLKLLLLRLLLAQLLLLQLLLLKLQNRSGTAATSSVTVASTNKDTAAGIKADNAATASQATVKFLMQLILFLRGGGGYQYSN